LFRHSPEARSEPVLFGSSEREPEPLIQPNSAFHERRGIEKQTFVTIPASKIFNPRKQQFSNSPASHARVHSHAPDVQCRVLGVRGYRSNNFMPMDRYPHCPVLYSVFYLMLPRRSKIECFRCISQLMLTKGFSNEQLDRRSIALVCSSYLNDGLSSHCSVNLRSRRTKC
jgi:hypothetical protein